MIHSATYLDITSSILHDLDAQNILTVGTLIFQLDKIFTNNNHSID